jgi:hypothetical protein
MEENKEVKTKGCVYFFRHIGLSPVKIGYSTHESPIGRFDQFKTYAPYGSEIIGFIQTFDAKEIETTLHEKFSQYRLNGEWFDISEEECNKVIYFYSNIEDIKEKNEFQIAWAKHLDNKNKIDDIVENTKKETIKTENNRKSFIKDTLIKNKNIKVKELALLAGCSKKTVYQYKNELIKQGVNF